MDNVIAFPKKQEQQLDSTEAKPQPSVKASLTTSSKREVDRSQLFHCTRCNNYVFQITYEGLVVCDDCDALITTLQAVVIRR